MDSPSKNISVAAYLSPIGFIVAMVGRSLNNDTSDFVTFHIRQACALAVIEIVSYVCFHAFYVFWQLLLLAFIFFSWKGVNSAVNERMDYLPYFGKKAEEVLKNYF